MHMSTVLTVLIALALLLALATRAGHFAPQVAAVAHGGRERPTIPFVALCERESQIFVSIASYRDTLCRATIDSMFANAKYPSRCFAGVYEQNSDESESCFGAEGAESLEGAEGQGAEGAAGAGGYPQNVRVVTVDASKASGPCTARHQCSLLMRDEPVFLQIDSHTEFARDWDVAAIATLRNLKGAQTGAVVVSTYPVNCDAGWQSSDPPVIDRARFLDGDKGGWLTFDATIRADAKTEHKRARQIGGGFLLCVAAVIRAVPFDPGLAGTFNGEEILYSARLFTHGIDVVAPRENLVCHKYTYAEHRTIWNDRPDWSAGTQGNRRVDTMLTGTHADLYGAYGMGKARTLAEFWEHVGIEYTQQRVGAWQH